MYANMDEWMTIRRRVLVEGVSKRQVLRETGMHWSTLEKILPHRGIRWQTPAAFAAAREDKTARQDGGRVATLAGPAVGAAPLPPAQPANDQPILS